MPNNRTLLNLHLLTLAVCASLLATLAHAQASNVELLGMLGGRVIGGAKACGINPERVRKAADKLLLLVRSKASSSAESAAATRLFAAARTEGETVRADKDQCSSVHVELSGIEVKLAKFPGGEPDASATARAAPPVPPLGALPPELTEKTAKP